MTSITEGGAGAADKPAHAKGPLIYRQTVLTRVTHWVWAVAMFFLLLSGLQIFNAHPALYWGQQSGFAFDNAVLEIGALNRDGGPEGFTTVLRADFQHNGCPRDQRPGGPAAIRRLPRLGDDPVVPGSRHRARGALLLCVDIGGGARRLADRRTVQRPHYGATWC